MSGASGCAGFALAAATASRAGGPAAARFGGVLAGLPEALKRLTPPVRILLALATHAPWLTGKLLASQVSNLDSAASRWGRRFMPPAD